MLFTMILTPRQNLTHEDSFQKTVPSNEQECRDLRKACEVISCLSKAMPRINLQIKCSNDKEKFEKWNLLASYSATPCLWNSWQHEWSQGLSRATDKSYKKNRGFFRGEFIQRLLSCLFRCCTQCYSIAGQVLRKLQHLVAAHFIKLGSPLRTQTHCFQRMEENCNKAQQW